MTASGASFAERVLNHGFATVQQLEDALRVQQRCRKDGYEKDLGDIMFERGYLTRPQLEMLVGEMTPPPGSIPLADLAAAIKHSQVPAPVPVAASAGDEKTRFELPAFAKEEGAHLPMPTPDPDKTRLEVPIVSIPSGSAGDTADMPRPDFLKEKRKDAPAKPAAAATKPRSNKLEIPGYELEAKLGEGAMGEVHKAKSLKTGNTVAIKVLPPHLATNKEYIARFHREAASAKKLQHANIVGGLDDGEVDGFHYFVMEFVDGESLEKRLKRMGKLPEAEVIEIALGVVGALECAYQQQIVHRDLKPGNIQRTSDGRIKVLDLGLAKSVGSGEAGKPQLTKVGIILGSPYYLAPEQAAMTPVDHRTDLYSLGATLFHLVTGTVAFDGDTPVDIVDKLLSTPAPDAHERAHDVSIELSKIIDKLMAKKKENRFQTPMELRDALQQLKTRPRRGKIATFFRRLFGLKT